MATYRTELDGHGFWLKVLPSLRSGGPGGEHKKKGVKSLNDAYSVLGPSVQEKTQSTKTCLHMRVGPRDGEFQSWAKPRGCLSHSFHFQRWGNHDSGK